MCRRNYCDVQGHGESHHEKAHMTDILLNVFSSAKRTLHLVAFPMMNVHDESDIL